MPGEVYWRLHAIERVLDDLPRYAALWPSMGDSARRDVRMRWWNVLQQIDYFRRNTRIYRLDEYPDWWVMLQLRIEEAERLIVYMELTVP